MPPLLVLVRDLLLASRVTTAARARGVAAAVLRDPAALAGRPARRLIVDLNLAGAPEAAAAWHAATGGDVVAFVAHTDAAAIAHARGLGLATVLPRSALVARLDELVNVPPDPADT